MKLVAKIFNWITVGLSAFVAVMFILVAVIFTVAMPEGFVLGIIYGIMAIPCIVPVIVCIISNVLLDKAKTQKELIPIAIVTLILGNMVSGILMLVMKDEDLINN